MLHIIKAGNQTGEPLRKDIFVMTMIAATIIIVPGIIFSFLKLDLMVPFYAQLCVSSIIVLFVDCAKRIITEITKIMENKSHLR